MTTETICRTRGLCPHCGKKGKPVSTVTLRALLKDEFPQEAPDPADRCSESKTQNGSGCQAVTEDIGWRFCDSQDCDAVYFAEKGDTTFAKSQLRVPVGVKETTGERPLCYCFGHSVASIQDELRTQGRSDALEDVRGKMKNPGCRCETENPSGSCCLGSVTKGIKIAREELGMNDADGQPPAGPSQSSTNRGEKIAKIGTLVSAVMASSCCWLPLVLLAAGVSGAGIASTLEAYRPLFMVVTFGFLAAAFYFTYRPRKAAAGGGDACCAAEATESEACCPPAGRRRFTMVTWNKAMLWVVTAMAVAFLFFPSYVGAFLDGGDGKTVAENMNRAVLEVEGMTCDGCSALVAKAIRDVPGVLAVDVDFDTGKAVVGTAACCPVPRDEILAALEKLGYTGRFVRQSAAQAGSSDS